MLRNDLQYLCFDFETTGLDIIRNEPIQVGLIIADHTGTITQTYSSLIKPQRSLSELKDIVGYITGLSIEDLSDAPDIITILEELKPFFTPNTVLIGHNVQFDLGMLQKYRPDVPHHSIVDTFPLAQTLLHYKDTYALDALTQDLLKQDDFKSIKERIFGGEVDADSFHDALQDSKAARGLFQYCINKLVGVIKFYPDLHHRIVKADSVWSQLIKEPTQPLQKRSVPPMGVTTNRKATPPQVEQYYDFWAHKQHSHLYHGNIALQEFLLKSIKPDQPTMIAVSTKLKLDIIKHILQNMGHTNLGFTYKEQHIDRDLMDQFAYKGHYTQGEISFLIKYLSHVKDNRTILQTTSSSDWYIFNLLTNTATNRPPANIILTTHYGLYQTLEEKSYPEHQILFLDSDRWYNTYNQYCNNNTDPYRILSELEQLQYSFKTLQDIDGTHQYEDLLYLLNQTIQSYAIFVGVLFIDITQHFTGTHENRIDSNPILDDISFYKTQKLWAQTEQHLVVLLETLPDSYRKKLNDYYDEINQSLQNFIVINKRMYAGDKFYYTFSQSVDYTDFSEFIQLFDGRQARLFSHHTHTFPHLDKESYRGDHFNPIASSTPHSVINILTQEKTHSVFILSTAKHQSQGLFTALYEAGFHNNYQLLVENLTWGFGKNMRLAQNPGPKIIIGGYNFALALGKFKLPIDKLIVYHLSGPLKNTILTDINYYHQASLSPTLNDINDINDINEI